MDANGKQTVLVVEDDPWARAVTSALLAGEGYAVLEAKNGEDGYALAVSSLPNVILLDVGLPVMSGLDVMRNLKQEPRTRGLPVIIVSAFGDLVRDMHVHEPYAVLQKPFDYDELVGYVRGACGEVGSAPLAYSV